EGQPDEQLAQYITAISRHGARAALEVRAARTLGRDGQVSGMAIVFRDLSEQMRIEAERQRLAAIVESSSDAIIGKTLDGRITSWNRGAQDLFGYTADEAIGQPVQMLIPPERAAEEMRLLTDLARGISVPPLDTVRRAKDGSLREVSVSISPIRDGRGRVVGASKIARDMGEQRRAERALRDSEERLRFTLETSQIGSWDLDLASGRISRSRRHDQCFGYSNLQPEWTSDIFLDHVHPEDRDRVQRKFRDTVKQQTDWSEQYRVIWPDGSVHWLAGHGSIRFEGGRPRRMLGTVSDITSHKQAEEARLVTQQLQAENQQIQEANRLKSRFLANMSHELRTPLNAIIGFGDLLHRGVVPASSDKHREYLGHISSSGRHLLQLINDVLDLAKVEAGKLEFFPEQVLLPKTVQEVQDVLQPQLQRKQLQFITDLDPALGALLLDPARLKQALFNYISNAIKFTPEGGRITVRTRAEQPRHVRIEVEDTGIGIAAADMPRLFTEFQQLDAGYGKHHQGTGLGLSLVRRLAQAQGGSVGVRSELGVGSVFWLVLPRSPGDGAALERVLVVEPDARLQAELVDGLADVGYAVDVAVDAAQAVRHSQDHAYAGITLDLHGPDGGGLALLETIRAGHNGETPVLALSLPASVVDQAEGDAEAAVVATFAVADVLSKPLQAGQVVNALGRLRKAGAPLSRVMVVDDDPLARELMRATLSGMGLVVTALPDGQEALREIPRQRPDAMVLDLAMRGFDGLAVLDALARTPGCEQLPVFVWTVMRLDEAELHSLSQTARTVLGNGGGTVSVLLQRLRQARQQIDPPAISTT
ncbi:MAG TPA: PAS domain S-box protein, partial [Rubrivivax sp.]|nr:PAS domain S-box protein [Rubrivivax sp.]